MAEATGPPAVTAPRKKSAVPEVNTKALQKLLHESTNCYAQVLESISIYSQEQQKQAKLDLEEQLATKFKNIHELCAKIQHEIEKIQHHAEREKKKTISAIGADFRLTPEEQDIAYELKAKVMRNLHAQSQKIKAELELHERSHDLRKAQLLHKKLLEENQLSQSTLVHLNDSFEKKLRKSTERIRYLEKELTELQELVQTYEEAQNARESDGGKARNPNVLIKSIRSEDALRKNELLISDNDTLKRELHRLKTDNGELLKKAKHAEQEMAEAKHQLGTVEASRVELQRRFEKEQKQHHQLRAAVTRQASDTIVVRKQLQQVEDMQRLEQIFPVSPLAARERTFQYPVKKNVDQPRQMLPLRM